jgi:hypothetical protein
MDATRSTGFKTLVVLPRVCEKSSASSALGRDQQDADTQARSPTAATGVELLCQEETRRFDPFWDGPKLLPAFVAQVLGQMIAERRDSQMPLETAYGRAGNPRMALLLDRKS